MTEASLLWVLATFFIIALFYSMVGFGGGSSYLAVLAMTGLAYQSIAPIALLCNVVVAGGGFIHFVRGGHFRVRKALPFIILSIPMAYWGGSVLIPKKVFFLLLGLSLLFAAIRMLMPDNVFDSPKEVPPKTAWCVGVPTGALLGFVSGLTGIGGGIFLSPLLLFLRWVNVKQAGACASFFIIINSIFGLLGQLRKTTFHADHLFVFMAVVLIGGQIGSRIGSFHLPKLAFQRTMALLIAFAAIKTIVSVL